MSQYIKLFGTSRIPNFKRDYLTYTPNSNHIIVISKNQFFELCVLNENGEPIPENEIQSNLYSILKESSTTNHLEPDIGIFTTEERNRWAFFKE